MSATETLLLIASGVCLLIWGVGLLKNNVIKAYGAGLRMFLARSTSNRVSGFFSGILVTLILQSSTATALMVSSFAGQRLITTTAALAVILGADVGTTLVAQILSFDLSMLAPTLFITGVALNGLMGKKASKYKYLSNAIIALGLMLLSLKLIMQGAQPLKDSLVLRDVMATISDEPFLVLVLSILITWIIHSSLAFVLLVMSFTSVGIVDIHLALIMVLGANLGGIVTLMLLMGRAEPDARRVILGNGIMRLVAVAVAFPLLSHIVPWMESFGAGGERIVVNFHLAFNAILALFFIGLLSPLSKFTERFYIADENDDLDRGRVRYLDHSVLDMPSAALACAARETLRLGDMVEEMYSKSILALKNNDGRIVQQIIKQDDDADRLYDAIKHYMVRISERELSNADSQRYQQILTFATNLEHVGDILTRNLMEMADKKIKAQARFSEEGYEEIASLHKAIANNFQLAFNVFMSSDSNMAAQLVEEKKEVRDAELRASTNHIKRLRQGNPETLATSSLHMDIIRDLKRINSHVASVAYPILESKGILRESRLRKKKNGTRYKADDLDSNQFEKY